MNSGFNKGDKVVPLKKTLGYRTPLSAWFKESKEQKMFFEKNGYLVVEKVTTFEGKECLHLRTEYGDGTVAAFAPSDVVFFGKQEKIEVE